MTAPWAFKVHSVPKKVFSKNFNIQQGQNILHGTEQYDILAWRHPFCYWTWVTLRHCDNQVIAWLRHPLFFKKNRFLKLFFKFSARQAFHQRFLIGSLRCYDVDGNKNVKKLTGSVNSHGDNSACAVHFFVHFFAVITARLRRRGNA